MAQPPVNPAAATGPAPTMTPGEFLQVVGQSNKNIDDLTKAITGLISSGGTPGAGAGPGLDRNRYAHSACKIYRLSSVDPQDWFNWRKSFEYAVAQNDWGNDAARRAALGNMEGSAADRTAHIDAQIGKGPNGVTGPVSQLLDEMQGCMIPANSLPKARTEFRASRQRAGEAMADWHTRVRRLYRTANPHKALDRAAYNSDPDLTAQFIDGIAHPRVREATMRATATINDFEAALGHAYTSEALDHRETMARAAAQGARGSRHLFAFGEEANSHDYEIPADDPTVAAMEQRSGACYICKQDGHRFKDCPGVRWLLSQVKPRRFGGRQGNRNFPASRGNRRVGGQRGRGRFDAGGRRTSGTQRSDGRRQQDVSNNMRSLNAVDAAEDDEEDAVVPYAEVDDYDEDVNVAEAENY